jgi:uncharacterized membrane protein
MKPNIILAILLIAAGVVAILFRSISYTTKEKVVDLGPIQVMADRTRTLPLTPIFGGLAILGGVVLLVAGSRKG